MNKAIFEGKKVIIFDMDGTLIDSVGMWNKTNEMINFSFIKQLFKIFFI